MELTDEYEMLIEYNKVMNLTGITEKEEVYLKHFYDSLTINKIIDLKNVDTLCDLGSGAGFPGVVIKILFPNIKITLVDSLNKRINFLNDVIKELNLNNIVAIHSRIEDYALDHNEEYDVVTARAVAPINILLELGVRLVKVDKYFIAMKGNIENEPNYTSCIEKLNLQEKDKVVFSLPIENSTRTLIKFVKKNSTNKLFPRKFSDIKKRPL